MISPSFMPCPKRQELITEPEWEGLFSLISLKLARRSLMNMQQKKLVGLPAQLQSGLPIAQDSGRLCCSIQLFPPRLLPLLHILFPLFACTLHFTSNSPCFYVLGNTLIKVRRDLLTKIHGLQDCSHLFDLPIIFEAVGHVLLLENLFLSSGTPHTSFSDVFFSFFTFLPPPEYVDKFPGFCLRPLSILLAPSVSGRYCWMPI